MAAALEDIGEHAGAASEISHAGTGRKSSAHIRGRCERTMLSAIFRKLPTQKILAPREKPFARVQPYDARVGAASTSVTAAKTCLTLIARMQTLSSHALLR